MTPLLQKYYRFSMSRPGIIYNAILGLIGVGLGIYLMTVNIKNHRSWTTVVMSFICIGGIGIWGIAVSYIRAKRLKK